MTSGITAAFFACVLLSSQHAAALESTRCMACSAVSKELGSRLSKEKPRNHLDMRHRLDSEGNRYGKTIDYKFSELRIVELLDGICDTVSEYELAGVVSDAAAVGSQPTWQWLHPKSKRSNNSTRIDKPQLKQQQRRLQNYCAQLIDRAEEELSASLQNGISSTGRLADRCVMALLRWPTANIKEMMCRFTDTAMHRAKQRLPACSQGNSPTH